LVVHTRETALPLSMAHNAPGPPHQNGGASGGLPPRGTDRGRAAVGSMAETYNRWGMRCGIAFPFSSIQTP
jgi:hypothetical protein